MHPYSYYIHQSGILPALTHLRISFPTVLQSRTTMITTMTTMTKLIDEPMETWTGSVVKGTDSFALGTGVGKVGWSVVGGKGVSVSEKGNKSCYTLLIHLPAKFLVNETL